MSFKPIGDRLAIELKESDEKTAGGIIIPDSAQEKPSQGVILSVGEGARDDKGNRIPLELKPGQTVLFGKWAGTEVTIDGKKIMIIKESDVMGVIE